MRSRKTDGERKGRQLKERKINGERERERERKLLVCYFLLSLLSLRPSPSPRSSHLNFLPSVPPSFSLHLSLSLHPFSLPSCLPLCDRNAALIQTGKTSRSSDSLLPHPGHTTLPPSPPSPQESSSDSLLPHPGTPSLLHHLPHPPRPSSDSLLPRPAQGQLLPSITSVTTPWTLELRPPKGLGPPLVFP